MASKRKINQDDLRKMMAKVKTGASAGAGTGSSLPKRYKISSREKALIEEQEKQKNEFKLFKEAQNKANIAKLPPAPSPDAKPQKSILKNTSTYTPPIIIPSNISLSSNHIVPSDTHRISDASEIVEKNKITQNFGQESTSSSIINTETSFKSETEITRNDTPSLETNEVRSGNQDSNTNNSNIPEGFFDDPVQDAKARNVPYINVEEEEWEKFQKEIGEEMSTAQTILVEDREEATADRQIEEIDEQMEAWRRVSIMEQKIDQVNQRKNGTTSTRNREIDNKTNSNDSDSESDDDYEEFVSWRKKK